MPSTTTGIGRIWRPGSWIWVWVGLWVCEAPRVKVWTSCAQWQCTCVEHKNGYEVRSPRTLLSHSGATGSHTPRLCHSFNQIKWLIIGPNMFNVFFCTKHCSSPTHHPIAHILISVEILMNRIIIKTHWGEVGRASYKRNPSHETWAQLASQGAAQCVHIVMTIIVIIVVLPRDKSSGCSLLITTDTIMPKSQCHHFDSTILCLYISYSYLEFAFWDLFL